MQKYYIKVYDKYGNVISEQELWGSADVQMTLGFLNKNFPHWNHYTIWKEV